MLIFQARDPITAPMNRICGCQCPGGSVSPRLFYLIRPPAICARPRIGRRKCSRLPTLPTLHPSMSCSTVQCPFHMASLAFLSFGRPHLSFVGSGTVNVMNPNEVRSLYRATTFLLLPRTSSCKRRLIESINMLFKAYGFCNCLPIITSLLKKTFD